MKMIGISLLIWSTQVFAFDNTPCGLKGTVEERIRECSHQENSRIEGFELVARSKTFKEVWIEKSTDLLFSDSLPNEFTFNDASKICHSDLEEVAGIKLSWRLPTKKEYEHANISGIQEALPNIEDHFWTSSFFIRHYTVNCNRDELCDRYGMCSSERMAQDYANCMGQPRERSHVVRLWFNGYSGTINNPILSYPKYKVRCVASRP